MRSSDIRAVLLAPDETLRDALVTLIAEEGVEVEPVGDVPGALAICTARRPDLVVVAGLDDVGAHVTFLDGLSTACRPRPKVALVFGLANASARFHESVSYSVFVPTPPERLRELVRRCVDACRRDRRTSGVLAVRIDHDDDREKSG